MAEAGHVGDDGIDGGAAERITWPKTALLHVEGFYGFLGEVREYT